MPSPSFAAARVAGLAAAVAACGDAPSAAGQGAGDAGAPDAAPGPPPLWVAEDGFVRDALGRAVLLRGINMSGANKHPDPDTGRFVPSWLGDDDWARVAAWGLDSVRFLLTWEALEPERGVIDQGYLDEVADAVAGAARAGLVVVLDMHQDLYNRRYGGNGTPAWAVYDDGIEFTPREPWWMNYLEPAVMRAFDSFWQDREGIQTEFVAAWAAVAARFRDEEVVVGYDLLNEPFPGSEIDLLRFDEERLGPFVEACRRGIAAADPRHVIFFEPNPMRTNLLAPDGFPQAIDSPPGLAFAPHFYDPTTSQTDAWDGDRERLAAAARALADEGARMGTPVWVGEWGLLLDTEDGASFLAEHLALFDQHAFGWAVWDYNPGTEMSPVAADGSEVEWYVDLLARPYPSRVAGTPESLAYDPAARTLEFAFRDREGTGGPTEIVVPERVYPDGAEVDVPSDAAGTFRVKEDPARAVMLLETEPGGGVHRVVVRPR